MNDQPLSQRDAFWNKVYDMAKIDHDIIIITADMGAPALDKFRKDLPGQFVNTGIAEQNATTVAAGLALEGKKAFTYAIAPFITLRCLEQIRVENAIMKIPITVVGVGAGFGYEDSGPTHHLIEDIAVMRAFPHIRIDSVTDAAMAAHVAEVCCQKKDVTDYVRLDRLVYPDIYNAQSDFSKGISLLRDTGDVCVISTGSMTHVALKAADALSKEGKGVKVIDIFNIPVNSQYLMSLIKGVRQLVTIEEHFLAGGLGSAVAEVLADAGAFVPLKRIGLTFEKGYCYCYGGREAIREYYGVSQTDIEKELRKLW